MLLSFFVVLFMVISIALYFVKGESSDGFSFKAAITKLYLNEDFLATIGALIASNIFFVFIGFMHALHEDEKKTTTDYRSIIHLYSDYEEHAEIPEKGNYYDAFGQYQYLQADQLKHERVRNKVHDRTDKAYYESQLSINRYADPKTGYLVIPSTQVFVNTDKNVRVVFEDTDTEDNLPSFIHENEIRLFEAHHYSKKRNDESFRLNSLTYDRCNNTVTLQTARTTYYHMMLTNRCMDYDLGNGISLRNVYEFRKHVHHLGPKNPLSNQIGINGLIFTSDGYLILEKRDLKKSTWKNKYAQPISMAMALSKVRMKQHELIGKSPEDARRVMAAYIQDTLENNFGFQEGRDYSFTLDENFMGMARDLLEGGKPNLYFYVKLKMNHTEAYHRIRDLEKENKGKISEAMALVNDMGKDRNPEKAYKTAGVHSKEKLKTTYVLAHMSDIKVDYDYCMDFKKTQKEVLVARRPFGYWKSKSYGVGEALLSCISMAEVMHLFDEEPTNAKEPDHA